jgi:hypothetical protein
MEGAGLGVLDLLLGHARPKTGRDFLPQPRHLGDSAGMLVFPNSQ